MRSLASVGWVEALRNPTPTLSLTTHLPLKLGNFTLFFTHLEIPVSGIPITVTRTYDSLNASTTDDFGYGWRLEFRDTDLRTNLKQDETYDETDIRTIGFKDGTKVFITLPGGQREAFTFKPTPSRVNTFLRGAAGPDVEEDVGIYHPAFIPDKGVTSTLTVANTALSRTNGRYSGFGGTPYNPADPYYGGTYILTTKEGIRYEIDGTTGDLLTVSDTNGNTLTYTDSGITSNTGASVTFERDAQNRITSVTDPLGQKVRYTYDANGDLIAVTDREENTTQFEYDTPNQNHYLNEIIDPLGRRTTSVQDPYYLPKQTIFSDGSQTSTEYLFGNNLQEAKDYPTRVVDIGGNDRVFTYDEFGRLKTATNLGSDTYTFTYGDDGLEQVTSPLGETLTYRYGDALDNLTEMIYGDGTSKQMSYRPTDNRLGNITLESGDTITYDYNEAGQVTSQTTATSTTSFAYTAEGAIKTVTDLTGTTTYHYDSLNHLSSIDLSNGSSITYTYDLVGRLKTQTEKASAASLGYTTEYDHDTFGNLIWVKDPVGGITTMKYDVANRLTERLLPNGVKSVYEYDELDRVKSIVHTDAQGAVLASVTYEREGIGEPTKITREDGSYVRLKYDAALRLTEEAYYNAANVLQETITYSYDADGKRTQKTDATGNHTSTYKPGYQLDSIQEAGETEDYDYDVDGRLTLIQRDGKTLDLEHDEYDRLTDVENETTGTTTRYLYDGQGNRIKAISGTDERRFLVAPAGGLNSTDLIADEQGNLISNFIYAGGYTPFMRLDLMVTPSTT